METGAGSIDSEEESVDAILQGYAGCQLGTRLIATTECKASQPGKQAILRSRESDIVLSERITGIPVSDIKTSWIEKTGVEAGPLARHRHGNKRTKHRMHMLDTIRSAFRLRKSSRDEEGGHDFWQAGRSVAGIDSNEPAGTIIHRVEAALGTRL